MPATFADINLPLDDDDTCRSRCDAIVRRCRPDWTGQLSFEFFSGGITNRIFACWPSNESGRDRLVFRVYGRNTELIIDRKKEIATIRLLAASECAPPLEATFGNGIVIGYLPGETLDIGTVRLPHMVDIVTASLARFHRTTKVSSTSSDLWQRLQSFVNNRPAKFNDPMVNRRYRNEYPTSSQVDDEIQKVALAVEKLDANIVFCHNDLLMKNILFDPETDKISFIDYEYAFPNYQAFDVANHFNEFAGVDELDFDLYPDKSFQLDWIEKYLTNYHQASLTNDQIIDFYDQVQLFAALSHLFWSCWALVQAANSAIDFDFFQYSLDRWRQYLKFAKMYIQ